MSRPLPTRPNLEHLRKQAKELLPELRQQSPDAQLADAQHAVARGYRLRELAGAQNPCGSGPRVRPWVAAPAASPFAGLWTANVAKSHRHPANLFQRATMEFAIDGDAVTITDVSSTRPVERSGTRRRSR